MGKRRSGMQGYLPGAAIVLSLSGGFAGPLAGAQVTVTVTGPSAPISTGASGTFAAVVTGTPNTAVTWSVQEAGGGSITQGGVYTAPATPGTFTVRAIAQADATALATAPVRVVIPEGHLAGYDVGVDYHAYGIDFLHTAFITIYDQPSVRQTVRTQLQGIADRGGTVISTRIWFVTEPGDSNLGETWRATFPMTDQEQANLHAYAQDVAAIQGSGGNRLRLDIGFLWLGAADYTTGTPTTGLGYFHNISGAEFTTRLQTTTDKVLAAITGVTRPDGLPVVNIVYLNGEVMVGAKANEDWFMTTHYPRFVSVVTQAGFTPSVYFNTSDTQEHVLQDDYVDVDYPILNKHRSTFWVYRTLRFMVDQGLPIPARIDFSYYVLSTGAPYSQILTRVLDDADATLPSLGAAKAYGFAETFYFPDDTQRRQFGKAIADEVGARHRLKSVTFWTTPWSDGRTVSTAYPWAIEDYLPPPSAGCTVPPTFAGLSSVGASGPGACSLDLSWSPASAVCGTAITYNVYRSTSPGLAAALGTRIARCVPGTTYSNLSVASGTTYYYKVRAEDNSGSGAGPCGGNEEANDAEKSAATGPSCIPSSYRFYTLEPCRILDTRSTSPLGANTERTFAVAGQCGVPSSAKAVSMNLTVTQPTAAGNLRVYPVGTGLPPASNLNYSAGQTRANSGVFGLGDGGAVTVLSSQASGTAQAILDVNGYFE